MLRTSVTSCGWDGIGGSWSSMASWLLGPALGDYSQTMQLCRTPMATHVFKPGNVQIVHLLRVKTAQTNSPASMLASHSTLP